MHLTFDNRNENNESTQPKVVLAQRYKGFIYPHSKAPMVATLSLDQHALYTQHSSVTLQVNLNAEEAHPQTKLATMNSYW